MAVAWLPEIVERDPDGNALCTGRFECEGVELPFREALAWARAHADRAYIDIEFERYLGTLEPRELIHAGNVEPADSGPAGPPQGRAAYGISAEPR